MNGHENVFFRTARNAGHPAHAPAGGRPKLILLGIILPLLLACLGSWAWLTEEVFLTTSSGSILAQGKAAKSLAVACVSIGLFCHFRWLWGLLGFDRVFETGTVLSLLGFLGGMFAGFYFLLVSLY